MLALRIAKLPHASANTRSGHRIEMIWQGPENPADLTVEQARDLAQTIHLLCDEIELTEAAVKEYGESRRATAVK